MELRARMEVRGPVTTADSAGYLAVGCLGPSFDFDDLNALQLGHVNGLNARRAPNTCTAATEA